MYQNNFFLHIVMKRCVSTNKREPKKAARPYQLRGETGTETSGAPLPKLVTSPALLASYHIYSGNEPVTASYQRNEAEKR